MKEVKTICPYCGVGCGLLASTDGQEVFKVRGDPKHPANFGALCAKGNTVPQTIRVQSRLRHAMIRNTRDEPLLAVSPSNAITHVAKELDRIIQTHGPQAIAFYLSGQMTTESQYLFNKFAKGYLRTNHVDSNSRLCMSSAAAAMTLSLGSDGPPTCYADIDEADTFLFIGSNAAECHPVTFGQVQHRMKKAKAECVVVDPRRTATAQAGTLHLAVRPGTDLALLNGLLKLLLDWGMIDRAYVEKHTEGWDELEAMLADYPAEKVARICGVAVHELTAVAKIISRARRLITFWTMGVNQTVSGTFTGNAIINLHLATGQIGKRGAGPFSLTGQPNAMGGRDVGYMAHLLPGQRQIADPEHRKQIEQLWGLRPGTIHPHAGYDAVRMFEAMESGEIKALWVVATNPAASMPDLPMVRRALANAELVILQDAYRQNETTDFAHVLLPGALNVEQAGTFCNSERRVSLMEQVVTPLGDAKPDWWWGVRVAERLGFSQLARTDRADQIFDEFARVTAGRPNDQSALTHALLREKGPQQWPYPALGESSARRFTDGLFPTRTGKARFFARPHAPPEERPTREFPLVLTTGRVYAHWHTRTKTGVVDRLNALSSEPFVEMHPMDVGALGLRAGEMVEVHSRRGFSRAKLRVSLDIAPGVVFMPIHWNECWGPHASPNESTTRANDPVSRQPSLKACAVAVVAEGTRLPEKQSVEAQREPLITPIDPPLVNATPKR